jgi:hypothetical protein
MRCEQLADVLAEAADGSLLLDGPARHHVDHCLRCQAEIVQYRKLLRSLHAMRVAVLEPAPGLLPEILATIEAAGERRALRQLIDGHRVAYLGGLAAATAAGVGGAIVIASRSKRRYRLAG